ncbi:MAG: cytidylate kinase-like family protein [Planctomycetes bacterium]|nr:cytidylate kinase-like family protein [Planctomycetota bacterium]
MTERYSDEFNIPVLAGGASPLHGYRGDDDAPTPELPLGVTIAISREAGARGATIAKRAGEKLGWEVYSQDMLKYGAQSAPLRQDVLEKLPPGAIGWIDEQVQRLLEQPNLSHNPNIVDLARLVLALGAQGNVILLGRGAGFLLPRRSTLHVRLVAPLHDRIAYMSQWLRLTEEEAADQVRKRDHRRTDFLATHFHRKPNDVHFYDMILNTSMFGEDRSADLIAAAAKAKMSAIVGME